MAKPTSKQISMWDKDAAVRSFKQYRWSVGNGKSQADKALQELRRTFYNRGVDVVGLTLKCWSKDHLDRWILTVRVDATSRDDMYHRWDRPIELTHDVHPGQPPNLEIMITQVELVR